MTANDTSDDVEGIGAAEGDIHPNEEADFVEYGIEERPPLGESVLLGFQHYLTMIGSTVAIPLVLIGVMAANGAEMPSSAQAQLIGTFFVVSGVATLAQTTIGNKYPIVQGGTFSMLAPAIAIIAALGAQGAGYELMLRELQGAVIVAAIVEVVVGYLGVMGALKRFISPVVIAPTIALIGLALFNTPQITSAGQDWWLLGLTLVLIILFSQYLDKYHRMIRLFPILLGIGAAWIIAAVLSVSGFYAAGSAGYVDLSAVANTAAIQPVTPFQWGTPLFTGSFVIGMFAGVLASMIESYGDYFAVARLSGMAAPSKKRIDHGIGMEGVGNLFAGIMGTGNGSTSYSENVGAIGITGVASRYVVQVGAVVMLIVGYVGYFGQLVATIPNPIVGGLFVAMFGQIAAVGLSNLQYVDLNANRNVFIVGLSLLAGLAIPAYIGNVGSADAFQAGLEGVAVLGPVLGSEIVSQTLFVILGTGMAVGGILAFVLDNTIDGTTEERGLDAWDTLSEEDKDFDAFFDRIGSSSD
jgi:xanthine/uracil permease